MITPRNIIISTRGHKLGDVIFSLPIATLLKRHFPTVVIGFLGTNYTKSIIEACDHIDVFIDKERFLEESILLNDLAPECIVHVIPDHAVAKRAKQLAIPLRIGTSRRFSHWLTCNRFVYLSRRNSPLHEIQLNLKILSAFNIPYHFSLTDIPDLYALPNLGNLFTLCEQLEADKFKLIIHAKSGGSAKEWALQHYIDLIRLLDVDKFQIIISGSADEREAISPLFEQVGQRVTDFCGKLNLSEFIGLVSHCDGLIACSTGPLHLAAALDKYAIGIYAPRSPIFAQRWGPVGRYAQSFSLENSRCDGCREDKASCFCIDAITPEKIKEFLDFICKEK